MTRRHIPLSDEQKQQTVQLVMLLSRQKLLNRMSNLLLVQMAKWCKKQKHNYQKRFNSDNEIARFSGTLKSSNTFFTPKWKHPKLQVRLDAIEKLDVQPNAIILSTLALEDSSAKFVVRHCKK